MKNKKRYFMGKIKTNNIRQKHTQIMEVNNKELALLSNPIIKNDLGEKNRIDRSFTHLDYNLVHNEIIDIKTCRTNIFTGTLGLISAAAIAVLTIWGTNKSLYWLRWLPFAAVIPLLLLSSSILTMIHKARGINKREGYLEILGEYLLCNTIPKYYGGWIKANRINNICKLGLPKKLGKDNFRICRFDANKKHCLDVSKLYAHKMTEKISHHPNMLENFTSLSLYLYSLSYLICLTTLLFSGFYALKDIFKSHFDQFWYISAIGVGVITPLFCMLIIYIVHEKYRFWIYSFVTIIGALIWYFIFNEIYGYNGRWYALLAYTLGLLPSALFLYMGYSFLEKVKSLRKGEYSVERWRYIWKIRLSQCPLMSMETLLSD